MIYLLNSLQFARLLVKLPRPGDSEVTFAVFESSCHLLLPVTSELADLSTHYPFLMLNVKQGSCKYQL